MKFYDKYLTPASENIKQAIILLIVFVIGFVVGYFIRDHERNDKQTINNQTKVSSIVMYANEERI